MTLIIPIQGLNNKRKHKVNRIEDKARRKGEANDVELAIITARQDKNKAGKVIKIRQNKTKLDRYKKTKTARLK